MPLCPQITNTAITVATSGSYTVTSVLPVTAATSTAVNSAQSTATTALANAATAYAAAQNSLQPSAYAIQHPTTKQLTSIDATGLTVYSGASATSGARVVLNSTGLAGYNSGGSATFSVSASTGAAVFAGSVTGATITGGTLNIGGNAIIDASGYLTATGATITGTITATSGSFTGSIYASAGTISGFTLNASTITNGSTMTLYNNGDFYTGGVVSAGGGLYSTAACSFGSTLNVTGSSTFGASSFSGQMNYSGITTGAGSPMVSVVSSPNRVAYTTSSERFKEQITYIATTGWLEKVLSMQPITYKTGADFVVEGEPNETQIGFLAEDINDIGGGFETAVILDPLGDPFSLSYDRLTVFLMLAIKELKAEIELLKGA